MRGANVWRIVRLFTLFFMMSHWIGCIWYFLADDASKDPTILNNDSFTAKYVYAVFTGLLVLVGESVDATENGEYVFLIFGMVIGSALSATIFGSMASLIKNMDQGHDIFTNKMDVINDHIRYY